jgi:hypothetical protein
MLESELHISASAVFEFHSQYFEHQVPLHKALKHELNVSNDKY